MRENADRPVDLFIIGGGVNGCGIARDAAGRNLSVMLAEMGDLGGATSSASTKLFHGGLRYLEYFEIRLVREALREREVLLQAMPHISRPMRFVLPYRKDMRFEGGTPVSRLVGVFMPWLRQRRPAWLIRLGLFLYDHLGGRKILPGTARLDLRTDPAGAPLQDRYRMAYEYSDCWVDDARLVALNARDASARGAQILPRTQVVRAERAQDMWHITLQDSETGTKRQVQARVLVNAAGPWVGKVIADVIGQNRGNVVRLVRGSHIITRRLFDHDKAYFFQGTDGRIIFAIPYECDFTMIGTTEEDHPDPTVPPECTEAEQDYLCTFASEYFDRPVTRADIVRTFSGVRPLFDDGAGAARAATREYVLSLDAQDGAPLLNVFGGKITTYRKLSQAALDKLGGFFPDMPGVWTAGAPLPGGDFAHDGVGALVDELCRDHAFLDPAWARRLVRLYGTDAGEMLGDARARQDLGRDFGATLSEAELRWLMQHEFARTADDVVWRRTKLGLKMSDAQVAELDRWMQSQRRHQTNQLETL